MQSVYIFLKNKIIEIFAHYYFFSQIDYSNTSVIARVTLDFDEAFMSGVACNLDSPGYLALRNSTQEIVGFVKPYSITGSLPLIRELQVGCTKHKEKTQFNVAGGYKH